MFEADNALRARVGGKAIKPFKVPESGTVDAIPERSILLDAQGLSEPLRVVATLAPLRRKGKHVTQGVILIEGSLDRPVTQDGRYAENIPGRLNPCRIDPAVVDFVENILRVRVKTREGTVYQGQANTDRKRGRFNFDRFTSIKHPSEPPSPIPIESRKVPVRSGTEIQFTYNSSGLVQARRNAAERARYKIDLGSITLSEHEGYDVETGGTLTAVPNTNNTELLRRLEVHLNEEGTQSFRLYSPLVRAEDLYLPRQSPYIQLEIRNGDTVHEIPLIATVNPKTQEPVYVLTFKGEPNPLTGKGTEVYRGARGNLGVLLLHALKEGKINGESEIDGEAVRIIKAWLKPKAEDKAKEESEKSKGMGDDPRAAFAKWLGLDESEADTKGIDWTSFSNSL